MHATLAILAQAIPDLRLDGVHAPQPSTFASWLESQPAWLVPALGVSIMVIGASMAGLGFALLRRARTRQPSPLMLLAQTARALHQSRAQVDAALAASNQDPARAAGLLIAQHAGVADKPA